MGVGWVHRRRLRRRGEPVFAFIDPDVSSEPFLVDRVAVSATEALLDALMMWPGLSSDATYYVTDPTRTSYVLASFNSTYDEDLWLGTAERLAVEGGAPAVAAHSRGRSFRNRYASTA